MENEKNIKVFVSFILGAGIASALTFIFTKNYYTKEFEKELNDDFKQKREKKDCELGVVNPEVWDDEKDEPVELEPNYFGGRKIVDKPDLMDKANKIIEKENYSKMSNVFDGPKDDIPEGPIIISEEEFNNENNHYDKKYYSYYSEDDVLCDENERPVVNLEDTVSEDSLTSFDDDSDCVYVRNNNLSTDYEITKIDSSYSREVLGYDDEDDILKGKKNRYDY